MARQEVDIGIEGNDGTGDSIRESFRKVNENFSELYAVFGIGGQISFTDLSDTPNTYIGNETKIPVVRTNGTGIDFLELVSENFDFEFDFNNKTLSLIQISSNISTDISPGMGGPLNAGTFAIGNVEVSQNAVNIFNDVHNTNITIDDLVIDKKFADRNYQIKTAAGGGLRVGDEPESIDNYVKTVNTVNPIILNNLQITAHGFGQEYTGAQFVFKTTGTAPNNLVNDGVYYIRVIDENQIGLYNTASDAVNNVNKILISGGTGTFTITDSAYDSSLAGNWLSNVAMPRKSIVRRQGDTMEGALILHDHPGELSGLGSPFNSDDLQAATKLYVDSIATSTEVNLYVSTSGSDSNIGVPPDQLGRTSSYAFRSVNAAARKAEEIIESSPFDLGPYLQTITHTDGGYASTIETVGITASAGALIAKTLIGRNRKFIVKETIAHLDSIYANSGYDKKFFEENLNYILNAITLDVMAGTNTNYLSRWAGIRFYSNSYSRKQLFKFKTQLLAAINYTKSILDTFILENIAVPAEMLKQDAVAQYVDSSLTSIQINSIPEVSILEKINTVINSINNGPLNADPAVEGGNTYIIEFNNGSVGFVDQGGDTGADIIPGKLVRGKTSGAIGEIISYVTGDSGTTSSTTLDKIELQLLEPVEFVAGEEIEYANKIKKTQIAIRIESGIYEEDLPIRVPANVSIVGDEFRRSIIKPKNRVSQSTHNSIFFYRDKEFDGLTVSTTGVEYTNPLTGEVDGYFGRHYLENPSQEKNIGTAVENIGAWNNAALVLEENSGFIVEQTVNYIEDTYPAVASAYKKGIYQKQIERIVLNLAKDLRAGSAEFSLESQGEYYKTAIALGIETEVADSYDYVLEIISSLFDSQAPTAIYGTDLEYVEENLFFVDIDPPSWQTETAYVVGDRIKQNDVYYLCVADHISDSFIGAEISNYWEVVSGPLETVESFIDLIKFAFDNSYNPPLRNTLMDVFLMNDATILRNISVQAHGGFMCVLDPEGQVLTKSPYIQTGSSFSASLNKQAFRGGMYIDAFAGNSAAQVTNVINEFELEIQSLPGQGLFLRKPQTPCPFYVDGVRFQVNAIKNYDATLGTAELILDRSSNNGLGFQGQTAGIANIDLDAVDSLNPLDITLQTAGNRSMLGNDFTQVNDLGYGLVCVNGALSEMVSMFTYYCWASYYSKNGSQIRSLTGSSCYGEYGLIADGADPNEIPDDITLAQDMVQSGRTFSAEVILKLTGVVSALAKDEVITQGTASGKVSVSQNNSDTIYLYDVTGAFNNVDQLVSSIQGNLGVNSVPAIIDASGYINPREFLSMYVYDMKDAPSNRSEFDIYHPNRSTLARYEVANVELANVKVNYYEGINDSIPATVTTVAGVGAIFNIQKTIDAGYTVDIVNAGSNYAIGDTFVVAGIYLGGATPANNATIEVATVDTGGEVLTVTVSGTISTDDSTPVYSGQVYKLNFSTSDQQFSVNGLLDDVLWGDIIGYRRNQTHLVQGVAKPSELTIRPSTAVLFDENPSFVYRSISFLTTDSIGTELPNNNLLVEFDEGYDYIRMVVNSAKAQTDTAFVYNSDSSAIPNTGTLGATQGDTVIAIEPSLDSNEIFRLNNNSKVDPLIAVNAPIFVWNGKKHYVYNFRYVDINDTVTDDFQEAVYAIVDVEDFGENINRDYTGTGLTSPVILSSETITLRAGLATGADGDITVNISTCRANSHDFLDVGTGGYNSSNYPNVIFGAPQELRPANEVDERGKGRVFYVSTDQDGVFRVGRFFSVDQGTGTVTFAASIALSDVDGLGFKRGVVITEFSTDTAMADNASDTVPTESAVRGYVNRRLGFDSAGNVVVNRIGPGAVPLDGSIPMIDDLNMNNSRIVNVDFPREGVSTDVANKGYVDAQVALFDSISELTDVSTVSLGDGDILVYNNNSWVNYNFSTDPASSDVTITFDGSSATLQINSGAIVNDNISASAAIDQSKLNLLDASATVKGIASFDDAKFTVTNGSVTIKTGGVTLSNIENINQNQILGRIATGTGAVTAISITDALNAANAVVDSDFTAEATVAGDALIKTGAGAYAITNVTDSGENSSIVKTTSTGKIQAKGIILGSDSNYEVLTTDALAPTRLVLKTPGQGIILTSSGSTSPTVEIPGSVNINSTGVTESTLQSLSNHSSASRLAVDWIYSSFIEASAERGAGSTGIAIGANTGKTVAGEIGLIVADNSTSVMPIKVSSTGIVPDVNNVYSIGSASLKYNTVYATLFSGTALEAYYADLAENYLGDADYEPGTVLVFGGEYEVTVTNKKSDHRVAGVVTTNPAQLMNSHLKGDHVVGLALQGRVPCKVIGRVEKGDILVTSAVPGYAIVDNDAPAGRIIGKSLENKNTTDKGIVEVVVGKH